MTHTGFEAGCAGGRGRRGRHGFTLIEMLLVVLIIAVLAGTLATSLAGRTQEARVAAAKSDINAALSTSLDLFEHDFGRYPTDEEGLRVLMENPGDPEWRGPYLKSGLRPDPWGQPYEYKRDPNHPDRYLLSSGGPDKQVGNEDDIDNSNRDAIDY